MGIGKPAPCHDFPTKRNLFFSRAKWYGVAAAMQVFSEIVIVYSLISFEVIVENDNPDISVVGLKWLDNEGKAESSSYNLIVYIFDVGKKMDPQSGILAFPFENYLGDFLFLIEGDGVEEGVSIIYSAGPREHIVPEEPCLEYF